MSGIYIPGFFIPDDVNYVLLSVHKDGTVVTDFRGGWEEYVAIPVPDHGRLIDADALCKGG